MQTLSLPATLVKRQTMRELERKVLELRRSGFDEDMIRRFVNASKQNAQATTEAALREHFILEKIAEEEKVDAEESDYDAEIALIAQQSDMPERRVRARLEKQGPDGCPAQSDHRTQSDRDDCRSREGHRRSRWKRSRVTRTASLLSTTACWRPRMRT